MDVFDDSVPLYIILFIFYQTLLVIGKPHTPNETATIHQRTLPAHIAKNYVSAFSDVTLRTYQLLHYLKVYVCSRKGHSGSGSTQNKKNVTQPIPRSVQDKKKEKGG